LHITRAHARHIDLWIVVLRAIGVGDNVPVRPGRALQNPPIASPEWGKSLASRQGVDAQCKRNYVTDGDVIAVHT